MQNIRLTVEYEGTNYRGWQRQERLQATGLRPQATGYRLQATGSKLQRKTIQGILEEALSKITKERIRVIGAGRTDAGVHALGQAANFRTKSKMTPEEFKKALNSMLPKDIVIKNAQRVKESFHAQFDAKSKYYRYIIYQGSTHSPFLKNYTIYILSKLNLKAMREGAKYLVGKHNFSSFQLSGSSVRTPIRTITKLSVTSHKSYRSPITDHRSPNSRLISIDCVANGFLYGMLRSIVGTLIEVGRGKISPSKVKEILKAHDRRLAGPTAPAKGLYLIKVKY
ncbi:tRNA pseudouridine(38-40) synthase TruA [bacterium]|nr:tRNA pseudouridine(38-40) synthase TruA [bacterium]